MPKKRARAGAADGGQLFRQYVCKYNELAHEKGLKLYRGNTEPRLIPLSMLATGGDAIRRIASNEEEEKFRADFFEKLFGAERDLAEIGLATMRGAAAGGMKSGEARRQKAAQTWQPHALELARDARKQQPSLSQDNVVAEIEGGWKLANPIPPGAPTLKAFISKMERSGKLQRRQKS